MTPEEILAAARAQLDTAVCFLIVTVDDGAVLKYAVLKGTPLEESAVAMQARSFAALVERVQAEGVAVALGDD